MKLLLPIILIVGIVLVTGCVGLTPRYEQNVPITEQTIQQGIRVGMYTNAEEGCKLNCGLLCSGMKMVYRNSEMKNVPTGYNCLCQCD